MRLLIFDRAEDQAKVRLAIKNKTVRQVVPRSTASTSGTSQANEKKKRKASFIEPPSFASTSATPSAVVVTPAPRVPSAIYPPTASQVIEAAEEADVGSPEDEPLEELYTTLQTSIVGVQYYKGYICVKRFVMCHVLTPWVGLVGYGEQVKLEREPGNQYDR